MRNQGEQSGVLLLQSSARRTGPGIIDHTGILAKKLLSKKTTSLIVTGHLAENIAQLCLSDKYSDITLTVDNVPINAHKFILGARSQYFRDLLYSEKNVNDINIEGAPTKALEALLQYLYSGQMVLPSMCADDVLHTLGLAHRFCFAELEVAITDYLRRIITVDNVFSILHVARLYGIDDLIKICHFFMIVNAHEILRDVSFISISIESLEQLLEQDAFFAPEMEIFRAICIWCKANKLLLDQSDIQARLEALVSKCLRLPLLSEKDLYTIVKKISLISPNMILKALQEKHNTKNTLLKHRGQIIPDVNVASAKNGAAVIEGINGQYLLDGVTNNYGQYTYHTFVKGERKDNGIVVKLKGPIIINRLRMLLWDKDIRWYSYKINISIDNVDWVTVVNYADYYCRSWQDLYITPSVAQYIKIIGNMDTAEINFHAMELEAYYTQFMPQLIGDFVCPTYNVATYDMHAKVMNGENKVDTILLNGDVKQYDSSTGFTAHIIGSQHIIVELTQPYAIGSIRLLLWDQDERTYSYYIETSINRTEWETVVDKRNEQCRSWQMNTFTSRPMAFIRITGTKASINSDAFRLVHFECPAQQVVSFAPSPPSSLLPVTVATASSKIKQTSLSDKDSAETISTTSDGILC